MRRIVLVALAAVLALIGFIAIRDVRRGYRTTRGFRVERFTLRSRLVGRDLHEVLVVPRGGGRRRPLLVFLHGRSSSASSNLSQPLFDDRCKRLRMLDRQWLQRARLLAGGVGAYQLQRWRWDFLHAVRKGASTFSFSYIKQTVMPSLRIMYPRY